MTKSDERAWAPRLSSILASRAEQSSTFLDRALAWLGVVAAVAAWLFVMRYAQGYDAHAYWIVNAADPYSVPYGGTDAFSYSPVAAQVFQFVRVVPFAVFYGLWT